MPTIAFTLEPTGEGSIVVPPGYDISENMLVEVRNEYYVAIASQVGPGPTYTFEDIPEGNYTFTVSALAADDGPLPYPLSNPFMNVPVACEIRKKVPLTGTAVVTRPPVIPTP